MAYYQSISAFIYRIILLNWSCDMSIDYVDAHEFSANHRDLLIKDNLCGCFYCMKIFNPALIDFWLKDKDGTAVCPFCGIDSIIGKSSGYPITKEFLSKMNKHWFEISDERR